MMMTAMAISPMMRNVLSVATMLPTAVMASDTATIAPTIVPMIRRMSPSMRPGPLAGYGRAGPSRIWRWAPQRPLEQPRADQCKPPAMLTAGDSSRAGTGTMCVWIADTEAVDKPRRFGNFMTARRCRVAGNSHAVCAKAVLMLAAIASEVVGAGVA